MMASNPRRPFRFWHECVLLVLFVALLAVAEGVMPGFLDWKRQMYLSRHLWEFAILATGMTMVIISGGIDLSVGSTMGLAAIVFGMTFDATHSLAVAAVACLATGAAGGMMNGWLIARFQVHPLIITLATYAAYRGMAEGLSQGASYSGFPETLAQLSRGTLGGVPWPGIIFIVLAVATSLVLNRTTMGRQVFALGYNERAAHFSGIVVQRTRFALFTLTGLLAGVAALLYVARFNSAKADVGKGFELDVITAVVVGGTSIYGGRGSLVGTTLGLLLIHETRLFVSRYWQMAELEPIVIGGLLVLSVLAYRWMTPSRETER